jgi:hypothetical protein
MVEDEKISNSARRSSARVSWSGGKDSSLALYEIQKNESYDIARASIGLELT